MFPENFKDCLITKIQEVVITKKEVEKYINFFRTSYGKHVISVESQLISKNTNKDATLLSIGSGPAIIESHLQKLRTDIKIITIDNNINIISQIPQYLHPILADGKHLPFSSNIFDIVICITSLEFMSKPPIVINEIHTVLKQNGVFLALLLNLESRYVQRKIKDTNSYIGREMKQHSYSTIKDTLKQHFKDVRLDFVIREQKKENNEILSSNHHRLIVMKAKK